MSVTKVKYLIVMENTYWIVKTVCENFRMFLLRPIERKYSKNFHLALLLFFFFCHVGRALLRMVLGAALPTCVLLSIKLIFSVNFVLNLIYNLLMRRPFSWSHIYIYINSFCVTATRITPPNWEPAKKGGKKKKKYINYNDIKLVSGKDKDTRLPIEMNRCVL